jgi:hypothetical protein
MTNDRMMWRWFYMRKRRGRGGEIVAGKTESQSKFAGEMNEY